MGEHYSLGSATTEPCIYPNNAGNGIGPWTQAQLEAQMRSLVPVAADILTQLASGNNTARVRAPTLNFYVITLIFVAIALSAALTCFYIAKMSMHAKGGAAQAHHDAKL